MILLPFVLQSQNCYAGEEKKKEEKVHTTGVGLICQWQCRTMCGYYNCVFIANLGIHQRITSMGYSLWLLYHYMGTFAGFQMKIYIYLPFCNSFL